MDLRELEIYLLTKRKLAPATVLKTVQNIRRLETKNALSNAGFQKYTLSFLTNGKSKSYFNKYVQAIKHYCDFTGQEWGKDTSYFAEDEKIRDAFTDEEIEQFLALPRPEKQRESTFSQWVCFWNFCASTGCRPIEARTIQLTDIDLKNKLVRFTKTKTHLDREVPIGERLLPILSNYIKTHPGNGFLFYYRDPKEMLSDVSYLKDFHQRCDQIGVKNRQPYSFRHSFGTRQVVDAENPLNVVMGLMGHKNPKTTLRYAHDSIKAKRRAINKDSFQEAFLTPNEKLQQLMEIIKPYIEKDSRFSWNYSDTGIEVRVKA